MSRDNRGDIMFAGVSRALLKSQASLSSCARDPAFEQSEVQSSGKSAFHLAD